MSAANLIVFPKDEKISQISYLCSYTNTTRFWHRSIHVGSFELTNATPVAHGGYPAKWTWEPPGFRCENYVMHFLFNSLWPDDTIWWHKSGSALDLVMSWCFTAPNHADISLVRSCCMRLRTLSRRLLKQIHSVMSLKVTFLKLLLQLPGNNALNHQCQSDGHQKQIWSIFYVFGISLRLSYSALRQNHWLGRHIEVIFATQCQLIDMCYIGCYLYLPHHPGKTWTMPKWSASLYMRPKTSTPCMTDL